MLTAISFFSSFSFSIALCLLSQFVRGKARIGEIGMRTPKKTSKTLVIDKMCEDFSSFIRSVITGIAELSREEISLENQKKKQTRHVAHAVPPEASSAKHHDFLSDLPENSFLRLPQVLSLIPVSKSTWWEGCKSGRFPKPIHLGPRTTVWRVGDIRTFLEQYAQRDQ